MATTIEHRRRRSSRLQVGAVAAVLTLTLGLLTPLRAVAQEAESSRFGLTITKVSVNPSEPAADTLCSLSVEIDNPGEQIASQLEFRVEINGMNLPVYDNQVFMYPVAAGAATEIPLYNFWSTETSRPLPADGRLEVEVTLVTAQWMKIGLEDDVEVWEPLGAVEDLPVSRELSLSMKK